MTEPITRLNAVSIMAGMSLNQLEEVARDTDDPEIRQFAYSLASMRVSVKKIATQPQPVQE